MHRLIKTALVAAAGIAFAVGAVSLMSQHVYAHGDKPHKKLNQPISTDVHPWGREGDPKRVTRSIQIGMTDNMRFSPSAISVKQGETIRFVVQNKGQIMHEMVIGSNEELNKHAEQMRKHPNMEHDEPYMAHVAAGKKADMVWHFSKSGSFEFACLIPGHFEAGMRGTIVVTPRA